MITYSEHQLTENQFAALSAHVTELCASTGWGRGDPRLDAPIRQWLAANATGSHRGATPQTQRRATQAEIDAACARAIDSVRRDNAARRAQQPATFDPARIIARELVDRLEAERATTFQPTGGPLDAAALAARNPAVAHAFGLDAPSQHRGVVIEGNVQRFGVAVPQAAAYRVADGQRVPETRIPQIATRPAPRQESPQERAAQQEEIRRAFRIGEFADDAPRVVECVGNVQRFGVRRAAR